MRIRNSGYCQFSWRMRAALRLAAPCLAMSQILAADPGEALFPKLQNLNNRQQESLQREQQIYKSLVSTPATSQEEQRLIQRLKRQDDRQRQLQQQHRYKTVTGQQRALSLPEGKSPASSQDDLGRFRRNQEAQRLQFKIQRRSWPVR